MAARPHAAALARLGLPAPAAGRLERYLDLLAAWSARVNLTAARTPAARVALLVEPVLPALPLVEDGPLIDVGSGNGSPGLVLALLRPELAATLLEPRLRRWAFLREAARAAGRPEVAVLRQRHDEYAGPPAPAVSVRALALPPAALRPLVAPGGLLLVFGPPPEADDGWTAEPVPPGLHALRRRG